MIDINGWLLFRKTIMYEIDYLRRKFRPLQVVILFLSLVALIVISLGDTQSFFIGENSPIPNSWSALKDRNIVNIISVLIITVSYALPWLADFLLNQKENEELADAIKESLIPALQTELKSLRTDIKSRFKFSSSIRLSIFIPIRQGIAKWSFQMVCKTNNVPDKELLASFNLDEGVIGYTFLKSKKHCVELINFSDCNSLPKSYKHLTYENEVLINKNIQSVLVIGAFQEGTIVGLLAIDTEDSQDMLKMSDESLHDNALDWIIAKSNAVRLLWRMKNHV